MRVKLLGLSTRVSLLSKDCLFPDPLGISEARSDLNILKSRGITYMGN